MPKQAKTAVAYYRVSTDRQGDSGLGLEAQREAVQRYAKAKRIILVKEYTEVESGKKNKRPVLLKALTYCKKHDTVLIIAKLNRLGRNVAFISALMERQVKFVAVEFPDASRFILHILAAVDEHQREEISANTKAALRAAKKRGVKLGRNGKALAERNRSAAQAFAEKLAPIIQELRREGFRTIEALTDEMNKRKIATYRPGSKWHKSTVHRLLTKLF